MADIAISYSHRDSAAARLIESELTAAGRSVWLDAPSERTSYGSGITLPSGQNHWEVISREFVNASVIVVVATKNWFESKYCQDEYDWVQRWGKWVVFVYPPDEPHDVRPSAEPVTTVPELLIDLERHEALAEAHARLVSSASHSDNPTAKRTGRIEGALKRSKAKDAETTLAGAIDAPWHCVTPPVDQYIRKILERDRKIRRRLRTFVVSAVATLSVFALAGVTAWAISLVAQQDARMSANRAQSIALANRSASETSTLNAVRLAQRAVELHRDSVSENALAVATDRDSRLRTVNMRADRNIEMTMAPIGERGAAVSMDSITIFNRTTGVTESAFAAEVGPRFGSIVFTPTADRVVFIDAHRSLTSVAVAGGPAHSLATNVDTIAADGEQLWWSSGQTLYGGNFTGAVRSTITIPSAFTAMSVDGSQRLLDAIGRDGSLYSYKLSGEDPTPTRTQAIGRGMSSVATTTSKSVDEVKSPSDSRSSDALTNEDRKNFAAYKEADDTVSSIPESNLNGVVKRCGQHVFGGIANYQLRILGTIFDATDRSMNSSRSVSGLQPPLCVGEKNAWTTSIYGDRMMFVPGSHPYLPINNESLVTAQDSTGRIYALSLKGQLYSMMPASMATKTSAAGAYTVVKIGELTLGFTTDGQVVNLNTGVPVATGFEKFYLNLIVVNSSSVAVVAPGKVVIVDERAHVSTYPIPKSVIVSGITGSVEGNRINVLLDDHVEVVRADGTVEKSVKLPWLAHDESVVSASTSPDGSRLAVVTSGGRIAAVLAGGSGKPSFSDLRLTPSYKPQVAYTRTGDLVVVSPEGQLSLLDHDMKRRHSVVFGSAPDVLQVAGNRILVSAGAIGSVVYRTDNLAAVAQLADYVGVRFTVHMNSSGTEFIGTQAYEDASKNTYVSVRLPPP